MTQKRNTISTGLTFAPVARATLQLLAELDGCSATGLLTRLLREELARRAPGAWEAGAAAARAMAGTAATAGRSPEERVTEVLRVLRARVGTR